MLFQHPPRSQKLGKINNEKAQTQFLPLPSLQPPPAPSFSQKINEVKARYYHFGFSFSSVLRGQQLKNPHLAVKHSPIVGGTMALVQGDYLYYHYMQDGFNDNVRLGSLVPGHPQLFSLLYEKSGRALQCSPQPKMKA